MHSASLAQWKPVPKPQNRLKFCFICLPFQIPFKEERKVVPQNECNITGKPILNPLQLFTNVLSLDQKQHVDRCHHFLRQRPADRQPPHLLILRPHYYHSMEDILHS